MIEFRARSAYYDFLFEQAKRVRRGEALPFQVPPGDELEFVDGWLVWNGRPVWWSGHRPAGAPAAVDGGDVPGPPELEPLRHPVQSRPKRRLMRLPWRRAVA